MKKFFVFVAFFLSSSLFLFAQGDCPAGQTTTTMVFPISYGGVNCSVEAKLCSYCSPLGPGASYIHIWEVKNPGCPGIPTEEIMRQISEQLIINWAQICQVENCTTATAMAYVKYPVCVKKVYVDEGGGVTYVNILPCNWSAYCEKEFIRCFDSNQGMYVTKTFSLQLVGTPNCPIGEPEDPTQSDSETECFQISCQ